MTGRAPADARSVRTPPDRYADDLRIRFRGLHPEVDDLFLLEAHQIAALPHRAPMGELAAVLHAHPRLARFLGTRCPSVQDFLTGLLEDHGPVGEDELAAHAQALLWELADWIVYQRAPEMYDAASGVHFDLAAVTEVVSLDGKVVLDAGAGTGRVAFAAAHTARHVFAVEPVAALRRFMRATAAQRGVDNLYVTDGFLHAIPLPANTVDVLLTCQAIGWALAEELREIVRVVKPGGIAQHLFGASTAAPDSPLFEALTADGYQPSVTASPGAVVRSYWKAVAASPSGS